MDADTMNPGPGATGGAFGVKLFRIRALVRRYWWVLLLTIAGGLAFQSWVAFRKADVYTSSSELMVRDELETDMNRRYIDSGAFVGNTLKMLQSPEVLEGARRRLELEAPNITGGANIVASLAPKTSIFTVAGTGTNPEYTRRFVDAVIAEFMVQWRGMREGAQSDTKVDITIQLQKVQASLAKEEGKLADFVKANNMQFWNHERDEAVNFLGSLRNQQNALTAERRRLENLSPDQLLSASPQQSVVPPGAPGSAAATEASDSVFSSELISQYLTTTQQLNLKQAQIAERSRIWKPKHPRMQMLQSEADILSRTLDGIREQAGTLSKARMAAIDANLKTLEQNIGDWTEKARVASEKDGEFRILDEAVKRLRTQEDKLMEGISSMDIRVDQRFLKVIRKASFATLVPKGTVRHLMTGGLGGLLVGALILFLLDRADDRLASSTELLEHFSEPILGQIPDVRDSRTAQGLPLLQAEDERYTYAEAYRSLRSSLIFMPNQSDLRALLITSAIPNEGKSTIATNLAITMANAGARVLLVDADLRRGDVATLMDLDGKVGLTNILRGELPWRDAILDSKYNSLFVIPRGPVTNQSGELLLKRTVEEMLEDMKSSYDLVVFNTAPILATDDTPTLAPHFDGVLMVIRAQFTGAKLTQNALQALYQRQVNVLGLILNAVDTETPDYYYYRYPKYYAA